MADSVLIVDDHPLTREALSALLAQHDFSVVGQASDGEEAIGAARRLQPRLVLLDLSMPGRSGEDTFRELRKLLPEVPVLLSSGYGEEQAKTRFAGEDLAGFLQKPYQVNTLLAEVERCLKPH